MLRAVAALFAVFMSTAVGAADLLAMYQRSRAQDATYAAARAAWQATQEKLPQGLALLLPSAIITADTQYNDRRIDFRNGTTALDSFNSNSLGASVTQPIFRPENLVQYQQAKVQLIQADAQLAAVAQELIVRVAQAYFDILLAHHKIELARAQKAAIDVQLAFARKNFDIGAGTITDVHEAQARRDLVTSQEVAALGDLDNKQRVLERIIGGPVPPLASLKPDFPLAPPQPNRMETWVEQSLRESNQVRFQEAAVEFARKEVERNQAAHLPTLDAIASHTRTGAGAGIQGGVGLDTETTAIGLRLAIPVFQGGAVNSRVREAAATLTKATDELEDARRAAAQGARQAYTGVTTGMSQVEALRSAVASSQRQLDSTQLGLRAGVRNSVDVLNAQQQLYLAQRELAESVNGYVLSHLRLKLAAGTLAEADVARVNAWLVHGAEMAPGPAGRGPDLRLVTAAQLAAPHSATVVVQGPSPAPVDLRMTLKISVDRP